MSATPIDHSIRRRLYWEADSELLDRPRPEYKPHVFEGNHVDGIPSRNHAVRVVTVRR